MEITWHGQSAFHVRGAEADVFIDPFGSMAHAPIHWDPRRSPASRPTSCS
jgi:L-ascorbate metabolism protein UlaG (beta-lactamase superfamily)